MAVMVPRVKGGDLRAVEDVLDELDIKADTDSLETKWVVASAEQEENKVKLSDLTIREGLVPRVVGMGAKDAVFLLGASRSACLFVGCRTGRFAEYSTRYSECLRGRPYY